MIAIGPSHTGQLQSGPSTLHGGVLCSIADSAMGIAHASTLTDGETDTTLELKITFLRPVWSDVCLPPAPWSNPPAKRYPGRVRPLRFERPSGGPFVQHLYDFAGDRPEGRHVLNGASSDL
jgi:hypothetical protein